jgi:hypothetical protein
MTTLDPAIYRKAAHVIREGGLTKGSYYRLDLDPVPHCTVGALQKATGQRELYNGAPEVQYLGHLLGLPPDGGCGDNGLTRVTRWNDRPETTAEDVITLLEQAAEKLEANQP